MPNYIQCEVNELLISSEPIYLTIERPYRMHVAKYRRCTFRNKTPNPVAMTKSDKKMGNEPLIILTKRR